MQQGAFEGRRLLFLHIQGGSGDPLFLQGTHQRLFIDHRAAGGVNEAGRGFHPPQKGLVDQVMGFGIQQGVD